MKPHLLHNRGTRIMFGFINGESYPLVSCDCLLLKMAIKIVDLPSNSMVIFQFVM